MKKILALMALVFLMGCDDGDMTFNTFNFSNSEPQSCGEENNIIYKVNGTEVLLLDLAPSSFNNAVTGAEGRIVTIGGTNRIIYRNYTGTVVTGANGTICSDIPPASPAVQEEWIGVSGSTVRIVTTELRNDDNELTGYTHQIILVDVRFQRGEEEITISNNLFGSYTTSLGYTFDFGGETEPGVDEIGIEDCGNLVYKKNNTEALIFSLPSGSFPQAEGTATITLDANTNYLNFRTYTGTISNAVICDEVPPVTPVTKEGWRATSGTIKITTSLTAGVYKHKILLSDVTFTNLDDSGETFKKGQGTDYLVGTYTPTP